MVLSTQFDWFLPSSLKRPMGIAFSSFVNIPQALVSSPHLSAASLPSCSDPVLIPYLLHHGFSISLLQAPQCFLMSSSSLRLLCQPSPLSKGVTLRSATCSPPPPSLYGQGQNQRDSVMEQSSCLQSHSTFLRAAWHTRETAMKIFIEAYSQMQKLSNIAHSTYHL